MPVQAGANYLKLNLSNRVKLVLPGIYRLTIRVRSTDQSRLYSIRLHLYARHATLPPLRRQDDLLVVTGPAVNDAVTQLLARTYTLQTVDPDTVFTAVPAPNETVGAVIVDATDGTGNIDTIAKLHFVFPDLRIVAVVASPAAATQAKLAGAAMTVVNAPTPDAISAEISQSLRTTLGH
jgi:hypothetical protein